MNKVIAAACGAWCLIGVASAQNYPTKTVRIIVPYPAGGTSDILARLLSAKLNDVFGQTLIVDGGQILPESLMALEEMAVS